MGINFNEKNVTFVDKYSQAVDVKDSLIDKKGNFQLKTNKNRYFDISGGRYTLIAWKNFHRGYNQRFKLVMISKNKYFIEVMRSCLSVKGNKIRIKCLKYIGEILNRRKRLKKV